MTQHEMEKEIARLKSRLGALILFAVIGLFALGVHILHDAIEFDRIDKEIKK